MNERRLKRMEVTPELIVCLGSGTFRVTCDGLPEDVSIVGCYYDSSRHVFGVTLVSSQFDTVDSFAIIPYVTPPQIETLEA